jgi:hypothetical protein
MPPATLGVAALVRPIPSTGIGWQAWLAAALPAAIVVYSLVIQRVGSVGGTLLIAAYALYLTLTFR